MATKKIIQCCVCNKVKMDDAYIEVESDYFDKIEEYFVHSHSYCPICFRNAINEINKLYGKKS